MKQVKTKFGIHDHLIQVVINMQSGDKLLIAWEHIHKPIDVVKAAFSLHAIKSKIKQTNISSNLYQLHKL